jgi:hypothetical protein
VPVTHILALPIRFVKQIESHRREHEIFLEILESIVAYSLSAGEGGWTCRQFQERRGPLLGLA